jgi:hypothetical protein
MPTSPSSPTAAQLREQPAPLTCQAVQDAANDWKAERVRRYNALAQQLTTDQQTELSRLLDARSHEATLNGLNMGLQRAGQDHRTANRQQASEQARLANERRTQNSTQAALLDQAARENRDLRQRAAQAECELNILRSSMAGIERVIRWRIIAAAPADHRPLPRLAPRSGVHHRYLSHAPQIRRVARRIEELMAAHPYRGSASRGQLEEQLLPETPAPVFGQALTHLLLSKRLTQSTSGVYRLRAGAVFRANE